MYAKFRILFSPIQTFINSKRCNTTPPCGCKTRVTFRVIAAWAWVASGLFIWNRTRVTNDSNGKPAIYFDVTGSVKWKILFPSARENFGSSNRNFRLNGSRPLSPTFYVLYGCISFLLKRSHCRAIYHILFVECDWHSHYFFGSIVFRGIVRHGLKFFLFPVIWKSIKGALSWIEWQFWTV